MAILDIDVDRTPFYAEMEGLPPSEIARIASPDNPKQCQRTSSGSRTIRCKTIIVALSGTKVTENEQRRYFESLLQERPSRAKSWSLAKNDVKPASIASNTCDRIRDATFD